MFLKLFLKEQAAKLEEFEMTKQKRSKKEEQSVEEKTTLHGKTKNLGAMYLLYMYCHKHDDHYFKNTN